MSLYTLANLIEISLIRLCYSSDDFQLLLLEHDYVTLLGSRQRTRGDVDHGEQRLDSTQQCRKHRGQG